MMKLQTLHSRWFKDFTLRRWSAMRLLAVGLLLASGIAVRSAPVGAQVEDAEEAAELKRDATEFAKAEGIGEADAIEFFGDVSASGGDHQANQFNIANDPKEHAEDKTSGGTPTHKVVEDIVPSVWGTQPVMKIGQWANSTATTFGTVAGIGTVSSPGQGFCAPGSYTGLLTTAQIKPGDSGGSILALGADNRWRAAGTGNQSVSGQARGSYLPWIPVGSFGPSAHWCTRVNPCGAYD